MPYKNKRDQLDSYNRWFARNKKSARATITARKEELRQWLNELKSTLTCSKCPENHLRCLDFHHRDETSKKFTISKGPSNGLSKESILKEIAKCDVLCANCHRKLHSEGM